MKKLLFCAVVLMMILPVSVFADRDAIEGAIAAYEAVAVEAEAVAEIPVIIGDNLVTLEENAEAVTPTGEALAGEQEWKVNDVRRLADLNARFNEAMTAIALNLMRY